jgi:hypothetical protein
MTEILDQRPRLALPRSRLEMALELAAVAGLLFFAWMLVDFWSDLPGRVPVHFNAAGQADGWGGRGGTLTLPVVGLVLYIGLSLLGRYPHIYNYPFKLTRQNVERQYRAARALLAALKAEIVWLFAYITWRTIQTAMGDAGGLGRAFLPVLLAVLFGTLGIYFYLARRIR